jgi:DNA replication licensing factor MCM3
MKKYIHIAKSMKPVLTDEANELIAESYANIRQFENEQDDVARTQPITVRALETMIRLATAHAKGRMSTKVEVKDAEAAIELVQFAYFKKIIEKPKKRGKTFEESGDEESDRDEGMGDDEEIVPKPKSRKSKPFADDEEKMDVVEDEADPAPESQATPSSQRSTTITVSPGMTPDQFKKFKSLLNVMFQKILTEKLVLQDIYDQITEQDRTMDKAGIDWALEQMQTENQVMVSDGDVYLI